MCPPEDTAVSNAKRLSPSDEHLEIDVRLHFRKSGVLQTSIKWFSAILGALGLLATILFGTGVLP